MPYHPLKNLVTRWPAIERLARKLRALAPRSLRLGRGFWRWYAFYEQSEQWSVDELRHWQFGQLRTLLTELRSGSAFYREQLDGVDLDGVRSLDDLRAALPTLDREAFGQQIEQIRHRDWRRLDPTRCTTSGTTGLALQFHHSRADDQRERAAIYHQWARVGFDPSRSWRAEFRALTPEGRTMQWYPEHQLVRCSVLDMGRDDIRYYGDSLEGSPVRFYHGYPSALYLLARRLLDDGLTFPRPDAVMLASEPVYRYQTDAIEEAFPGVPLFAHYGCAERTLLGAWCERRREYHMLPQYSLVEVDPENNELIGTHLFNTINGFVRYRMTDSATEVRTTPCPDCGRPYVPRLLDVAGRLEDFLYSPENGWIAPAIVTYPLKKLTAIEEIQFFQDDPDELVIRHTVRPGVEPTLMESERGTIEAGLRRLFGSMSYRFETVPAFERGPTGKYKWIICELEGQP